MYASVEAYMYKLEVHVERMFSLVNLHLTFETGFHTENILMIILDMLDREAQGYSSL